jgi:flagellar hook-basal body complex protein FliE
MIPMMQPTPSVEAGERLHGSGGAEPVDTNFESLFVDMLARANALGHESHQAATDLAAGRSDDIHGTMIELQKAGVQMRLVNSVRNKVVDAFYELWRMSV